MTQSAGLAAQPGLEPWHCSLAAAVTACSDETQHGMLARSSGQQPLPPTWTCCCRLPTILLCLGPLLLLPPLHRYELEAMYFDSHVRAEHYDKLQEALQEQLQPAFNTQLRLLAAEQLAGFDKDLTVALVEQPQAFSAAAEQAAAAALQGFDSRAGEYMVTGTDLTGEHAVHAYHCSSLSSSWLLACCASRL